jgi:hypothetical protein
LPELAVFAQRRQIGATENPWRGKSAGAPASGSLPCAAIRVGRDRDACVGRCIETAAGQRQWDNAAIRGWTTDYRRMPLMPKATQTFSANSDRGQ